METTLDSSSLLARVRKVARENGATFVGDGQSGVSLTTSSKASTVW